MLAVLERAGLVERVPVGGPDPLALSLGELREHVPQAVHRAALTVGLGPELLDRADQAGGAVGDDQQRRAEAAAGERAAEAEPVLFCLAHPQADIQEHPLAIFGDSPGAEHTLLRPAGTDGQEDGVEEEVDQAQAGEVALAEGLKALFELPAEPGGGRARHLSQACLLAERLDVAHREAADEGADHQRLQRLAGEEALAPAEEPACERRAGITHLRHLDHDLALAGLEPARPVAVALPRRRLRPPLVADAAEPVVHLLLDRALQHQPHPQPRKLAHDLERMHVDAVAGEQRLDLLLDLHRRQ